jgi:sensor domain CHASE-containing protein
MRDFYKEYNEKEVTTMGIKGLKVVGLLVTVIGAGLSVVSSIVADKKLDHTISEKVAKAVAKTVGK